MMKNYPKMLVILFLMTGLTVSAQQNVNMKFGKPTKEEMEMTVYAPDPDAKAVVLCRLTDVEYTVQTNSYLVDYREKCRIKVLKPSGAKFAKVVVPYQMNMSVGNNISGMRASFMTIPMNGASGNSSFQEQDGPMSDGVFGTDGDEMVEDIKATAFNMEGNKVVKTNLKKSDIVKTKTSMAPMTSTLKNNIMPMARHVMRLDSLLFLFLNSFMTDYLRFLPPFPMSKRFDCRYRHSELRPSC